MTKYFISKTGPTRLFILDSAGTTLHELQEIIPASPVNEDAQDKIFDAKGNDPSLVDTDVRIRKTETQEMLEEPLRSFVRSVAPKKKTPPTLTVRKKAKNGSKGLPLDEETISRIRAAIRSGEKWSDTCEKFDVSASMYYQIRKTVTLAETKPKKKTEVVPPTEVITTAAAEELGWDPEPPPSDIPRIWDLYEQGNTVDSIKRMLGLTIGQVRKVLDRLKPEDLE